MNTSINVQVESIEDFEKNIIAKKDRVDLILEQMIKETEEIKPFFNTNTGIIINEKLVEILNTKRKKISDINNEFVNHLKTVEGVYTARYENAKRGVGA